VEVILRRGIRGLDPPRTRFIKVVYRAIIVIAFIAIFFTRMRIVESINDFLSQSIGIGRRLAVGLALIHKRTVLLTVVEGML
jgi:hypothetical protein